MVKILVVEDDVDLAERLRMWLEAERHITELAFDGTAAMHHLETYVYDIVIMDWGLPGATGPEICQRFRSKGGVTPVIMLTGRDKLGDKEQGFESGADDYLTKPFELKELSARIRALMRRPPAPTGPILKAGTIELDPGTHRATMDGHDLELMPTEFALLEFFLRHPGQLFSPEALLQRVWDTDAEQTLDSVYTYIKRLRSKIDKDKKHSLIKTVYGMGYRLEV